MDRGVTRRIHRSALRFALESVEGIAIAGLALLSWPFSRRWLANWGSTPSERGRTWPGDTFVTDATATYTRAVDVAAPAEAVWRWVVQFGLGRAGFYSYELLERLAGITVRNVEVVLPAHQALAVGSQIKLHPNAPGIPVAALEPAHHVCFGHAAGDDTAPDPRRSWSVYIEPRPDQSCRLLLRSCIEPLRAPTLGKRLALALEAPIDFVMEQRMLRTIRRLAEAG